MKPPLFDYRRPKNLDEALSELARYDGDAKILAGGQSLVPMLNFRLLGPRALIDINRIEGLDRIDASRKSVRFGALVRHRSIEDSKVVAERLPMFSEAARLIGHLAIRNRGTIGGSLAHNDPAAEWPLLCALFDAQIKTQRPSGGRTIASRDFLTGYMSTALEEDEIVTEIEVPAASGRGSGWGFEEFSRRHGDFALVTAAVTLTAKRGTIREARIALGGVGLTVLRATAAEEQLKGQSLENGALESCIASVRECCDPTGDLHASADFRRHLIGVLAGRALGAAWKRATE